jgi:hypothetical protein
MIKMRKMAVLLLLLAASTKLGGLALGYGQTNPVIIISHRGLMTDTNYIVFGEVKNGGTTAIANVKVKVEFFDEKKTLLDSSNATAFLATILPGRRSPFICYLSNDDFKNARNYSLGNIFYQSTEAKPKTLALQDYYYSNGTLRTQVLNNSTGPSEKATNNIKVIGSLYMNETIVGVTSDFMNFPSPGLLGGVQTSSVGAGDPAFLFFTNLFLDDEVVNATQLVLTVESNDFEAEEEVILNLQESLPQGGGQIVYEWIVVALILVLGAVVLVKIRHDKRKHRAHVRKRK